MVSNNATSTRSSTCSLRICHLSDIHLGYRRFHRLASLNATSTNRGFGGLNQREVDVAYAFRSAIDGVIAAKPDLLVIAGDLFHTPRPSNAILAFCVRQLKRLQVEVDLPIVVVGGANDTPRRVDTGSVLRVIGELAGVHVADLRSESFSFPDLDVRVMCMPYRALPHVAELELRAIDEQRWNILVAHGNIAAFVSDKDQDALLSTLNPSEWDYIALGGMHVSTTIGSNAAYCGATEYTSNHFWNEISDRKGFLTVDLPELSMSFERIPMQREFVALPPVDAMDSSAEEIMLKVVEQLNAVVGGIDGKVVRMQIRNISHARYAELDHRILRDFRARALNLSIEIEAVSAQRSTNTKNKGGRRGLLEQLHEFIVDADGELALNDKRWASLLEYWERTLVEEERSAAVANAKRGQL